VAKTLALSLAGGFVTVVLLVGGAYVYLVHFEPRPEDTTAARVYGEDAYGIDYCDLPQLGGSGLKADEIPKAYTPSCETDRWPAPILAGCAESLPPEAQDLRGLWQATEGQLGHIERIEQCGNRVVVSGHRFLHDFRTTGKLAEGANDINTRNCTRVRATMTWDDEKVLRFKAFGFIPVVTRRLADENTLVWEYPDSPVSRLKRICRLPPRTPN
jgi:hypothetical protein